MRVRLAAASLAVVVALTPLPGHAQDKTGYQTKAFRNRMQMSFDEATPFRSIDNFEILLSPGPGQHAMQTIVCSGQTTRGGDGVRRARVRQTIFGKNDDGSRQRLGRKTVKSNRSGFFDPFMVDVTGEDFDEFVVDSRTLGSKQVDRLETTCEQRDFDPCSADECFGPDDRFQVQDLPGGFFFNDPSEFENGFDERWKVTIVDRCSQGGAMTLRLDRTVGPPGSIPDVAIFDTLTGAQITPADIFTDGFESGDTTAWTNVCP